MNKIKEKQLQATLKSFTFDELRNLVIHKIPNLEWKTIVKFFEKYEYQLNKNTLIDFLIKTINNNMTQEEITDFVSELILLSVGISKKRLWTTFELQNPIKCKSKDQILEKIKSGIRRNELLANVYLIEMENRFVLSIEKKTILKNRGVKYYPLTFYQFYLDEPFLFSSRRVMDNTILHIVIESLGSESHKVCQLYGPNVYDLLRILKLKEQRTLTVDNLIPPPEVERIVKVAEYVTDYGLQDYHRQTADNIYGQNPPHLKTISITLKNSTWQSLDVNDEMEGFSLEGVKLTINAPNVAEYVKEMITEGLIIDPIPEYLKKIVTAGKNDLKIMQA